MRCLFFVLLNLLSCRGRCVVSLGMIIAKGVGMSMWGFEKRSAELRQDVFCDALHGALMRLVRADMAPNFGAHPEPGGLTLSKIGLKPAGFRGIGFTGARAFTDKMKFPRARRVTRIFEKGTTVSRGFITPSKTGNGLRNRGGFSRKTRNMSQVTALSAHGSLLMVNTMRFLVFTVREPFFFGYFFIRNRESY